MLTVSFAYYIVPQRLTSAAPPGLTAHGEAAKNRIVGIGIATSVFALFLVSALPNIIENTANQWWMLGDAGMSEEALLAKFQEHPAYAAMYERFPDAVEVVYRGNGAGSM